MTSENMVIIKEEPIIYYGGCCPEYGQEIAIYVDDLRRAEVGSTWSCDDQDCNPNRTRTWMVSYTLVYKDERGCLLIYHNDDEEDKRIEMIWVEFR